LKNSKKKAISKAIAELEGCSSCPSVLVGVNYWEMWSHFSVHGTGG